MFNIFNKQIAYKKSKQRDKKPREYGTKHGQFKNMKQWLLSR